MQLPGRQLTFGEDCNSTLAGVTTGSTDLQKLTTEEEILGPALVWTFLILRALQGIVSIVGNLVTIAAVLNFEMLREKGTCRMVASLAFADLFWGMVAFCGNLARHLSSSIAYLNSLCYIWVIFNLLSGYGNVYGTLLCTLDRFVFITKPLRYQSIVTPGRASRAILLVWMLIVFQITLIVALGPAVDAEIKCRYVKVVSKLAFYETLVQFVIITFCVIVPMYVMIGYISWKANKNEPHLSNYPPEAQAAQREKLQERKWAKIIGMVLGTYLVCYVPFLAGDVVINFLFTTPYPFEILLIRKILFLIYNMQAFLNPFIYGWKNVHFRQAYNKLLPKKSQVQPI